VPLTQVLYAPPFLDMHNRMKEALVLLGRMDRAVARPPLVKIGEAEISCLRAAIAQAGLGRGGARGGGRLKTARTDAPRLPPRGIRRFRTRP